MAQRGVTSAAARLTEQSESIRSKWLERVRVELAGAQDQPEPVLLDNLPQILDALVEVLERPTGTRRERELFARHADTRIEWAAYTADELMREYAILRKVLFSVLEAEQPLRPEERDAILDFMDQGIQIGSARFVEVQRFNERLEMQYLKLIEHLVAESGGAGNVEDGLQRLLYVIVQGLDAEAAAFVLFREDTLELTLSTAAARSKQLADLYRGALSLTTITAPDREHGGAVQLLTVAELEPVARQMLSNIGIAFLVSVNIVSRGCLPASLCIGFREKRSVDPVETHLLEVLGDRLALLVASIELYEESKAALERARHENVLIEVERTQLEDERKRRDEVIATISHDLKNPLNAARMGAELIRRGSSTPGATERLADQILRSIGRSDRMIHDLLDSHLVRAGKKLPLKIEEYAMNDLIDEVVNELTNVHGNRFVVECSERVNGYWSWDGLRRVIENLLSNAVKYGNPESPIKISCRVSDGSKMHLAVHNEGPPLTADEQARIFNPFERGKHAQRAGKQGWGIGLTLVKGIIDAHGGTISVESTTTGGTTFTICNPMDSRPYQEPESQS